MKFIEYIDLILKPDPLPKFLAVDLFAGCGGMSLGFEAAGFETIGYEKDLDACNTYLSNLSGICYSASLNMEMIFPKADVLIAGPPCQPFSINGYQLGNNDTRNGFPVCLSAIEQISPEIFVLENVKGLMGKNKWYLDYLVEHLTSLGYHVTTSLLNAKDYLVPQNRERIFIIGSKKHRIEIHGSTRKRITAGEALNGLNLGYDMHSKFLTPEMDLYIRKYEIASQCKTSRDLHLDKPARTLTCRNLGGLTGDMLRILMPDGKRRRLTAKESARLQSFPSWFEFKGGEVSVFKQIGNAVAPLMAYHIARTVKEYLQKPHTEM